MVFGGNTPSSGGHKVANRKVVRCVDGEYDLQLLLNVVMMYM